MPFVFKLSRTGKDISSTNPQDFVFNSELGSVKIVKQPPNKTALNVTVGASTTATVTIAHNLGFIPLVMVYAEKSPSTGKFYNGYAIHGGSEVGDVTLLPIGGGTYVDATNLVLKFQNNTASQKIVQYYYYILGDSAT
jgi:hypothetical protein